MSKKLEGVRDWMRSDKILPACSRSSFCKICAAPIRLCSSMQPTCAGGTIPDALRRLRLRRKRAQGLCGLIRNIPKLKLKKRARMKSATVVARPAAGSRPLPQHALQPCKGPCARGRAFPGFECVVVVPILCTNEDNPRDWNCLLMSLKLWL